MIYFSLIQLICSAVILSIYLKQRRQTRRAISQPQIVDYLSDMLGILEAIEKGIYEIRDGK